MCLVLYQAVYLSRSLAEWSPIDFVRWSPGSVYLGKALSLFVCPADPAAVRGPSEAHSLCNSAGGRGTSSSSVGDAQSIFTNALSWV